MKLRIIHEDKYGNLLLTRKFNELIKALRTHQGNHVVVSSKNTLNEAVIKKDFSSTPKGTLILYQNSYGYAELAVNQGSAKETTGLAKGTKIKICKARRKRNNQ